jgi:hypothetical protein
LRTYLIATLDRLFFFVVALLLFIFVDTRGVDTVDMATVTRIVPSVARVVV